MVEICVMVTYKHKLIFTNEALPCYMPLFIENIIEITTVVSTSHNHYER